MERTPHILVVDDHRDIRDLLARFLTKHGLRASVAEYAAAARKALQAADIDLVVLDIMMPGEDGLSLTRSLRETKDIPVILLTAMGEETDRIVGLEVGADDYLAKPFNPRELLARIKAVLRRAQTLPRPRETGQGRLAFDRWILDLGRRELVDEKNVAVALSSGEFRLLCRAARAAGHGADARPAPRPDARALGAALRPLDRQPGQPAPQEDRARPAHAAAHQDRLGRRLQLCRRGEAAVRLLPKSLAGRLAALLVLTLVVAQVVTFALFAGERISAFRLAFREDLGRPSCARWWHCSRKRSPGCTSGWSRATSSPQFRVSARGSSRQWTRGNPKQRRFAPVSPAALGKARERRACQSSTSTVRDGFASFMAIGTMMTMAANRTVAVRGGSIMSIHLSRRNMAECFCRPPAGAPAGQGVSRLVPDFGSGGRSRRRTRDPASERADASSWQARRTGSGRGESFEPLPETGPQETRLANIAFNRMRERLERFVRDRTSMLAAIAHDLRTPITSLRLRAEFIEDEDARAKILETLAEMQAMTEAVLAFARGDFGERADAADRRDGAGGKHRRRREQRADATRASKSRRRSR